MGLLSRLRVASIIAVAAMLSGQVLATTASEYAVKGVFLFNFSQFVDWPASAFPDQQSPLSICVLGEDPFGAQLDEIVHGETVNGRPLTVQRFRRVEEVDDCHILFIDRSERERIASIVKRLAGRNVLTVGDFEGFARNGGVIRFVTEGNKIRLHVNLDAARAANVSISSKLLRPAKILAAGED